MKRIISLLLFFAIVASSTVCYADKEVYSVGDKVNNFSITLSNGYETDLNILLKDYDAVFINFFFIGCIWCEREFPFLEEAYKEYSEKVAVLAVSPYDSPEEIEKYKETMGLTFQMGACETGTLENFFGVKGYPTSFMIDREGFLCCRESTTLDADPFKELFDFYSSEDYTSPYSNHSGEQPTTSDFLAEVKSTRGEDTVK